MLLYDQYLRYHKISEGCLGNKDRGSSQLAALTEFLPGTWSVCPWTERERELPEGQEPRFYI